MTATTEVVIGHDLSPDGERTVLRCGHTVPGYLTYGEAVECPNCNA